MRPITAEEIESLAIGAWILGRNMFGPIRGEWDEDWRGWWGDDPPYHAPVFVLTHYAREPVEMEGGTTFHFVTDGIESALAQARRATTALRRGTTYPSLFGVPGAGTATPFAAPFGETITGSGGFFAYSSEAW